MSTNPQRCACGCRLNSGSTLCRECRTILCRLRQKAEWQRLRPWWFRRLVILSDRK